MMHFKVNRGTNVPEALLDRIDLVKKKINSFI